MGEHTDLIVAMGVSVAVAVGMVLFPRTVGLVRRTTAARLAAVLIATMAVGTGGMYLERRWNTPETGESAEGPSMAELWARTVTTQIGMFERPFLLQMPAGLAGSEWERVDDQFVHTMRWPDGSVFVTFWNPAGAAMELASVRRIGFPE